MTFSFDEHSHVYRLNGQVLPTLTGMLTADGWNGYLRDVPAEVLSAKCKFGTALHQALLHAEYGYEYDAAFQPHAFEWLKICRRMDWVRQGHPIWANSEMPMAANVGGLVFGMTPDRAHPDVVVELKATYAPHESHNLQTAMQVMGMGYQFSDRYVAYFDRKGFRKLIPCGPYVTRDGRKLDVYTEAERIIYEHALIPKAA